MQRAAVTGYDCRRYIIQNNNFGNPTGTTQILNVTGNRFTVQSSTASGTVAPGAFPSIYIGANGDLGGGTFDTWAEHGLPTQIWYIRNMITDFAWSGGASGGDYDAGLDLWFAKSSPVAGSYDDAISGFIKIWLYKPAGRQPIGSVKRVAHFLDHAWNVWVGPRGTTSRGTDDAGRPVITYVADSTLSSLSTTDLQMFFIDDAVAHGAADQSAGGTSQAFADSWYLTDVFAGFEIWSGSDAAGLHASFDCVVRPGS
jgi:hypothetical protein